MGWMDELDEMRWMDEMDAWDGWMGGWYGMLYRDPRKAAAHKHYNLRTTPIVLW